MKISSDAVKISILIPTHNRENFVVGAIMSALRQSHANIEVIVGVNGCSDGTLARVSQIRDERLQIRTRDIAIPMYANFNALVEAAAGDYVLMLSDDDVLQPNAISLLLDALKGQPGANVVFGAVRIVYPYGGSKAPVLRPDPDPSVLAAVRGYLRGAVAIYPCGTLLSRKVLAAVGNYDDMRFGIAADVAAWILVASRSGIVAYCRNVVADYMVHAGNETVTSSLEKWKKALSGIHDALEAIDYPDGKTRALVFGDFAVYRAECIGRSQSVSLAGGKLSIGKLTGGLRTLFEETRGIPFLPRLRVFVLWMGRIGATSVKKHLNHA